MTEPIPFKPQDPTERKERADESKEILDNKAFHRGDSSRFESSGSRKLMAEPLRRLKTRLLPR